MKYFFENTLKTTSKSKHLKNRNKNLPNITTIIYKKIKTDTVKSNMGHRPYS